MKDDVDDGDLSMSIYEKLVIAEKKERATALGVSISALEEAEQIQVAMDDVESDSPRSNRSMSINETTSTKSLKYGDVGDDDGDEEEEDIPKDELASLGTPSLYKKDVDVGSRTVIEQEEEDLNFWSKIPEDMTLLVLQFIGDVDMMGILPLVARSSPFWPKSRMGFEAIFKYLCEEIYLNQFQHQQQSLTAKRWRDSFQIMLIYRPRLRWNGLYSLRESHTRVPVNDRFWEDKIVRTLEIETFQHLRFFSGGRVLYAMNVENPYSQDPFMLKETRQRKPRERTVYLGTYTAKGRDVIVKIPTHYCVLIFELQICDGHVAYSQYCGKHSVLRVQRHSQVVNAQETVFKPYLYPDFKFVRDFGYDYRDTDKLLWLQ